MDNQVILNDECQKWLKTMGKEKIQAFQDSFAELLNMSLCLLSLDGKSITVWSNSSLFCYYMMKKNKERCLQERKNVIDYVLRKKEPYIYTCYMGLSFFCCPVFCNNKIIALFYGGAVYLEENQKLLAVSKTKFNVPVVSERKLKEALNFLENLFNLLKTDNINIQIQNNSTNRKELDLLQKKLSMREMEIVKLINTGLSNKEIAEELHISEKTVKTHVSNILKKLKVKDRKQVILFCKQTLV